MLERDPVIAKQNDEIGIRTVRHGDEASQRPGFAGMRWLDKAGRPWQEVKLAALAADMQFLAIAA